MFDKVSHTVQRQLEQLEMDDSKIEQIFDEENFAMRYKLIRRPLPAGMKTSRFILIQELGKEDTTTVVQLL